MYEAFVRPLLFKIDPEKIHSLTVQMMRLTGGIPLLKRMVRTQIAAHSQEGTGVDAFGLHFDNPVGLAAGYDKDGLAWRGLEALGFGHIEIGTVTPRPQAGNPKPRVFRIPAEKALINRMGFPGRGADFLLHRIRSHFAERSTLLGINIGKNKNTPNEEAVTDYVYLLRQFYPYTDYFTVNVSSPNTVGLRRLQARDALESLLNRLNAHRSALGEYRPILVKIAPDLSNQELDDALGAIQDAGMDGVIATNTTIRRDLIQSPIARETGGLSGAPLRPISRDMVSEIYERTGGRLPIVGVGGIMCADDAKAILDAGASLIQVYTGLIYAGPGFVKSILVQN